MDILGAVGLNKPNIAILSDEFLEEIKGIPQKNLAVELLKRLLEGRVKSVAGRNLVQSRKFSEMLEAAIRKYQNRAIETTQVILELIQLAREMNEMHRRGEETGLTEDELAVHSNRTISKEIIAEYFTAIKQKYNMLTPNDIENYAQVMFSRSMKS
ncbi:hypothetical protein Pmgp_02118 [Pelotomaculum propionicicum]|uniref:Type I restriction enzyme HindI endonuclease subunit-like C-terminal domain-containing protein n=1 Tax=Pelotomaculum propionicicum TaxID=258475 RepID=A0A4Y7RPL3_9FIRM|nr:hypothetical protein Pmgp_02118 [Pelotomaculum propionicicum]